VVAAVVERDGVFLVTRRLAGTHLAGAWEFPGGKRETGETDVACLRREMREELGVAIERETLIMTSVHAYEEREVELRFYGCAIVGPPRPLLGQQMRWAAREDLRTLPFPPADRDLIESLIGGPSARQGGAPPDRGMR
jgi:8-oxo-dGTP diphosphatase